MHRQSQDLKLNPSSTPFLKTRFKAKSKTLDFQVKAQQSSNLGGKSRNLSHACDLGPTIELPMDVCLVVSTIT